MAKLLAGNAVIVTGGARGIGETIVRGILREGGRAAVADVLEEEGANLARTLGPDCMFVKTDVTDGAAVRDLVERVSRRWGAVDVLVNNAAFYADLDFKPAEAITDAEWERVFAVNTSGLFKCCQAVIPGMKARQRGKIVNITSGAVFVGVPYMAHYVASKAAVIGITRALARELGKDGITVNAIAPGFTMTEASRGLMERAGGEETTSSPLLQLSIPRLQEPADLLGPVIYLASSLSDFVTGQTLVVDGGGIFH